MQGEAKVIDKDHPAFLTREGVFSYGKLSELIDNWLALLGPTRRLVFLQVRNTPDAISCLCACQKAGHVVFLFDNSGKIEQLVADYHPNLIVTWKSSEADLAWRHEDPLELHEDLRVLLSTSGSTGSQKLVRLSEENLAANATSICNYLEITQNDRAITGLKFSYSFGLSIITSHLSAGASLILTDESVTEDSFWTLAQQHGATSFSGVPYTFELLARTKRLSTLTTLQTVTQAGGRLSPDLISQYSHMGEQWGWRFFVMYGQTEASPRIAYLPPDRSIGNEDCIGVAIPDVTLSLINDDGDEITGPEIAGELVCTGANVMMGYASSLADLARPAGPNRLETGDLALRKQNGLYKIVGRKSRFIKLYGLRVNLDEVEHRAQKQFADARVVGDDTVLCVVAPSGSKPDTTRLASEIANFLGTPAQSIRVETDMVIPTLSNDKTDYKSLKKLCGLDVANAKQAKVDTSPISILGTFKMFMQTWWQVLGLGASNWTSVIDIYEAHFDTEVDGSDTFQSLSGDSLSFVSVYLALETVCSYVPDEWPEMSVRQLQDLIDA